EVALIVAISINLLLFLNYFPLPAANAAGGTGTSLKNAIAFGTFETSLGQMRYVDDSVRTSLEDIDEFTRSADRPSIIVSEDVVPMDWYMVWQVARYYLPQSEIWVTGGAKSNRAFMVRRQEMSPVLTGKQIVIRVPRPVRIIWLIDHDGPFHQ